MKATQPLPNGTNGATAVAVRSPRKSQPPASTCSREQVAQPATLMAAIIAASSDPAVDVGKVRELVDLHKTLQAAEWQRAFNEAMTLCQAELQPVAKNQTNTHTSSRYADLAKLAEVALPIVHKHGFALTFGELEPRTPQHVGIAVRILHRDGHTQVSEFHVPHELSGFKGNSSKTLVHSWGSALTYCRRYALLCAFNVIVSGDDDGQAAGGQKSSAALKREAVWPQFQFEMRAAKSLNALEAVCERWRPRINFWSAKWREAAVELKGQQIERLGGTLAQLQESAEQLEDPHSLQRLQDEEHQRERWHRNKQDSPGRW